MTRGRPSIELRLEHANRPLLLGPMPVSPRARVRRNKAPRIKKLVRGRVNFSLKIKRMCTKFCSPTLQNSQQHVPSVPKSSLVADSCHTKARQTSQAPNLPALPLGAVRAVPAARLVTPRGQAVLWQRGRAPRADAPWSAEQAQQPGAGAAVTPRSQLTPRVTPRDDLFPAPEAHDNGLRGQTKKKAGKQALDQIIQRHRAPGEAWAEDDGGGGSGGGGGGSGGGGGGSSVQVELVLDQDFDRVIGRSSSRASAFRRGLARDIGLCLSIQQDRVRILSVEAGSIKVTIEIAPAGEHLEDSAEKCARNLAVQACEDESPLRHRVANVVSARILVPVGVASPDEGITEAHFSQSRPAMPAPPPQSAIPRQAQMMRHNVSIGGHYGADDANEEGLSPHNVSGTPTPKQVELRRKAAILELKDRCVMIATLCTTVRRIC